MSQNKTNTTSLEEIAIQKALMAGHKNPRNCIRHNACLTAGGIDRKIIDYRIVKISDITDNNVRVEDIDVIKCNEVIAPLIQKKFKTNPQSMGLNYPLLVSKSFWMELISQANMPITLCIALT